MKARLTLTAALVLAICLVVAAPALAHDNGEGIIGETNDKIITYFSLGLVVFFPAVALIGSWLQSLLERRKEQRKASDLRQRVGW